jgi:hypothetical protein
MAKGRASPGPFIIWPEFIVERQRAYRSTMHSASLYPSIQTLESKMYVVAKSAIIIMALISTSVPSFAQKAIGNCMKVTGYSQFLQRSSSHEADCTSMQAYCSESRSSGKTLTNCEAASAQCSKAKRWIGTTPDGKKWSCTF